MCTQRVLGQQDITLARQYQRVSEKVLALFEGKKSLKASAKLLSWQQCASLQLWARPQTENTRCVNKISDRIYNIVIEYSYRRLNSVWCLG